MEKALAEAIIGKGTIHTLTDALVAESKGQLVDFDEVGSGEDTPYGHISHGPINR